MDEALGQALITLQQRGEIHVHYSTERKNNISIRLPAQAAEGCEYCKAGHATLTVKDLAAFVVEKCGV